MMGCYIFGDSNDERCGICNYSDIVSYFMSKVDGVCVLFRESSGYCLLCVGRT